MKFSRLTPHITHHEFHGLIKYSQTTVATYISEATFLSFCVTLL